MSDPEHRIAVIETEPPTHLMLSRLRSEFSATPFSPGQQTPSSSA